MECHCSKVSHMISKIIKMRQNSSLHYLSHTHLKNVHYHHPLLVVERTAPVVWSTKRTTIHCYLLYTVEEYFLVYIYNWGGVKNTQACFKEGIPFQVENNLTGNLILWEILFSCHVVYTSCQWFLYSHVLCKQPEVWGYKVYLQIIDILTSSHLLGWIWGTFCWLCMVIDRQRYFSDTITYSLTHSPQLGGSFTSST